MDRIRVAFDDHRLVANAGLMLPASLALRLGLGELVERHLDLGDASGRANTGDKLMTLVASALAGGDCIGTTPTRCVPVRHGTFRCSWASPRCFLVKAPSTPWGLYLTAADGQCAWASRCGRAGCHTAPLRCR